MLHVVLIALVLGVLLDLPAFYMAAAVMGAMFLVGIMH